MSRDAAMEATQPGPRFTDVRLLTDNVQAWQAKRDLIATAQRQLDLAYFIVDFDGTTSRLLMDLVVAAERGVRVRLLVDYFMTFPHAEVLRALAGVPNLQVRRYHPPLAPWLAALAEAGIDARLFVGGLVRTHPGMLAEATAHNTILPAEWFDRLRALKPEPDESRIQFALRVLAAIREVLRAREERIAAEGQTAESLAETALKLRAKVALSLRVVGGLKRFLQRTHHKLMLADQSTFIMGGRNLADTYQRNDPELGHPFADVDLHMRDRSGQALEHVRAFEALWGDEVAVDIRQADPLDDGAVADLHAIEVEAAASDGLLAQGSLGHALPDMDGTIVNNLPSRERGDAAITRAYVEQIRAAAARGRGAIDVTNAYLYLASSKVDSPTLHDLRQSLIDAARAGVTVRLRTNSPSTTDLKLVNVAAYPDLLALMDAGIEVWELEDGQGSLHAKVATIDDEVLIVGSYNFDPRSELYDTNNLIVLRDPGGQACRALRQHAVERLRWKRLTHEDVAQFVAVSRQMALEFRSIRKLL